MNSNNSSGDIAEFNNRAPDDYNLEDLNLNISLNSSQKLNEKIKGVDINKSLELIRSDSEGLIVMTERELN